MSQTFEMNKGNWTGEKTTLTVQDDGTFEIYDYKFRLEIIEPDEDGMGLARIRSVDGAWGAGYSLGTGIKFAKDRCWMFVEGDITRDDPNPYIAAAQLLYNTL